MECQKKRLLWPKLGRKGFVKEFRDDLDHKSESESHLFESHSLQPHGLIQSMEFSRPEHWSG